jgi:Zinc carboxypeptidase
MLARFIFAALLVLNAAGAAVPTPESHFGHPIGVDRQLLDWDKVVGYFNALAKSSDRIVVKELGKSTEGRPFIAAWIATPDTIRNLDKYREIQARLADPRKTTPEQAREFIAQGKTVVMITCSIHATEVASTHTAVEFAYRLLTENRPKFRAILDNTIFILVPSLNPDGVDMVTKWYRYTLGSQWEGSAPPQLYQKYVGHDNNRDWYIFSQAETRLVVSQLHNVWHPQIVYDVHQQGPYASRIFVPPWLDPVDPNIDAIIAQECNSMGAGMAADLTAAGKQGVAINALYDFWNPSRHYQAYHGGLRILSESASANLATPINVTPGQIQSNAPGYNPQERSWNYLEPWKGGRWSLRDIIDYQSIALESCLYQAAVRREDLLRNFHEVGRRAVARMTPYAFVIPNEQFDPGSAQHMLETLNFGQVEIEKAAEPFEADGKQYKKGSFVIRMQQPYSSWAKTLLERQDYPDMRVYPGGPPKRPYDVTAQTLPMLMGVAVDTAEKPFQAKLQPANGVFPFLIDKPRAIGVLPASDVEGWHVLAAAWANSPGIYRDSATGDFYFQPPPGKTMKLIAKPRIGVYRSTVPNMDEGWTRWLLEKFAIPYQSVDSGDVFDNVSGRVDVIVFPDQSPSTMADGFRPGTMPPHYIGGLGNGASVKEFVNKGGTAVFLNHATDYAIEVFGLKIKNVVKDLSNRDFYSPGSILYSALDTKNPLALGLPETVHIWSEGSPAWDVPEGAATVVARYPAKGVLASGWLLGEKYLAGKASLVEAQVGAGHVVLFGMRPQYRAQSYQTFKILLNSFLVGRY